MLALLLAACAARHPAPSEAPETCLPAPEAFSDWAVGAASLSGDEVRFCLVSYEASIGCYEVDLSRGRWGAIEVADPRAPSRSAALQDPSVGLYDPAQDSPAALLRASGEGMEVTLYQDGEGESLEVRDEGGVRSYVVREGDYVCPEDLQILDGFIYLNLNICAGPGSQALLLDPASGESLHSFSINSCAMHPVPLEGGEWAVGDSRGASVEVGAPGGEWRIIEIEGRVPQIRELGPMTQALVGEGERLVLILGGAAAGDLIQIDPQTGEIERLPAPRCSESPLPEGGGG